MEMQTQVQTLSNTEEKKSKKRKQASEQGETRNFKNYIREIWKVVDKEHEDEVYKRSTAVLESMNSWIVESFMVKVVDDWIHYSTRTSKTMVTDAEVAELIACCFPCPPTQPWELHSFAKARVEAYLNNSKQNSKSSATESSE